VSGVNRNNTMTENKNHSLDAEKILIGRVQLSLECSLLLLKKTLEIAAESSGNFENLKLAVKVIEETDEELKQRLKAWEED
jgi:hypothetical protein